MRFTRLEGLHNDGIYLATDARLDKRVTPKQLPVVQAWRAKKEINHDALEAAFRRLSPKNRRQSPVHFLDFEAARLAVPRYADQVPQTLLPFQYSLHTRFPDGKILPSEFLHDNLSDPTPHFLTNLIRALGDSKGRIVVYTHYEKSTLYSAVKRYPKFSADVEKLISRLFDLHEVVKKSFLHPDAKGRTSLKVILPLLVPGKSYENLAIQEGMGAVEGWMKYRESPTKKMRKDLLAYCKLDTQAMIDILDALSDRRQP